jgi:hypothetical protein
MRDLVDDCPEGEYYCGEDRPKAEAIGPNVFVGNNLIMRFDPQSDDYAFTHAREYAEMWNKMNGLI